MPYVLNAGQATTCARCSRSIAPEELRALIDRIEANGRGKPIGEQMMADAHGWEEGVIAPPAKGGAP